MTDSITDGRIELLDDGHDWVDEGIDASGTRQWLCLICGEREPRAEQFDVVTAWTTSARNDIRSAAREIDAARSAVANLADHQPVDFAVGDALEEARRQLAIALGRLP